MSNWHSQDKKYIPENQTEKTTVLFLRGIRPLVAVDTVNQNISWKLYRIPLNIEQN